MRISRFAAALSVTALLIFPRLAIAGENPPVVNAIFDAWQRQFNVKPTYQKLETDGSGNVVIEGLTATVAPQDATQSETMTVNIAKMELSGITDNGKGMFEISSTRYSDLSVGLSGSDGTKFSIKIPQSDVEGWYVTVLGPNPAPSEIMRSSMNVARKMTSGAISVDAAGQAVTIDGYNSTWTGDPSTGAGNFDVKISNIAIPEQAVTAMDPSGQLKKLGYSTLSFDLGGTGTLAVAGDTLGFDGSVFVTGKEAGTVKIGIAAANIPVAAYAELANPAKKEPDFTKLMPQLMGASFSNFQVRFEDASLTKRLLPIVAAMQGMDEQTFVASAGAMLQIALAQLKNQAFTAAVTSAVTTFLKDPKSITVSLTPAQPVQVQQIMSLDPANPGAAIDALGVKVTANE